MESAQKVFREIMTIYKNIEAIIALNNPVYRTAVKCTFGWIPSAFKLTTTEGIYRKTQGLFFEKVVELPEVVETRQNDTKHISISIKQFYTTNN